MPTSAPFNRRQLLRQGGLFVLAAQIAPVATWAQPVFTQDPFSLGVASGDPWPDGFVLWTRLAPSPLEPQGGMPDAAVELRWEVATDAQFRHTVRRGTARALPQLAHSVHVELSGLQPGTTHWYRFIAGAAVSPVGRVRTAPALGATPEQVQLAVVGCHHHEAGYFTGYEHLAREPELDLVFHYGDYIYETASGGGSGRGHGGLRVSLPERAHRGGETHSLADYRQRYAQYKSDPQLKAAHAAAAFAITFDDHEVDNDWAGPHDTQGTPVAEFMARRAAAFQAWYEHMPVRLAQKPQGPEVLAYRSLRYGQLLNLQLLDTRSHRSDQLCSPAQLKEGVAHCRREATPQETLLGQAQEAWLAQQLRHGAHWNVLAQQVMLMPLERRKGLSGPSSTNLDKWSGYPHARERLVRALQTHRPHNNIVLSGDIHQHFVGAVPSVEGDFGSRPIATEFLSSSLSSGGDGAAQRPGQENMLANNPHLRLVNDQRGYQLLRFTPRQVHAELRVIDRVEVPQGQVSTLARFVVEARDAQPHAA